jgi:MFS family permease
MAFLTRAADAAGLGSVLAIALANLAWALGHAVGSPLCGWLADRIGDTATSLLFAALCIGVLTFLRGRHGAALALRPAADAPPASSGRAA